MEQTTTQEVEVSVTEIVRITLNRQPRHRSRTSHSLKTKNKQLLRLKHKVRAQQEELQTAQEVLTNQQTNLQATEEIRQDSVLLQITLETNKHSRYIVYKRLAHMRGH